MPDLEVSPLNPDDVPAVVALVNQTLEAIPYSVPVDAQSFVRLGLQHQAGTLYPSQWDDDPAGQLVARERGTVVGFLHVVCGSDSQDLADGQGARRGLIRFVAFAAGRVDVGRALYAAAEAFVAGRGLPMVRAWHISTGYPFYHAGAGLFNGGDYVGLNALIESGYTLSDRWLCYACDLRAPVTEWTPALRLRVVTVVTQPAVWELKAYPPDSPLPCGQVQVVTLPDLSAQRAQPVGYLRYASVEEAHRQRGIGRWLLQRCRNDMHSRGYGELIAHVQHEQSVAQVLLPQIGFVESAFRGYVFDKESRIRNAGR